MTRHRHQQGHIYETENGFYVRYWASEDGRRVQRSHFLAPKSPEYYITTHRGKSDRRTDEGKRANRHTPCPALKAKRDQFMLTVNTGQTSHNPDMKITDFWTNVYLPYAENKHA